MMRQVLSIALLAGLLSGCSSPPVPDVAQEPQGQAILINTPGVDGATCIVQNGSAVWRVPAPGRVTLPRAPYPLDINCFKGEHLRGASHVTPTFAPMEAGTGEHCVSCRYPGIVDVALVLNDSLMQVPILRQQP